MTALPNFIHGLFPDGYHTIQSPNMRGLLDERTFNYLKKQGDMIAEEIVTWAFWDKFQLLSISLLRPVHGDDGRDGYWNHTILVPFKDYLELTEPINIFKPYFIHDLASAPKTLEPIMI